MTGRGVDRMVLVDGVPVDVDPRDVRTGIAVRASLARARGLEAAAAARVGRWPVAADLLYLGPVGRRDVGAECQVRAILDAGSRLGWSIGPADLAPIRREAQAGTAEALRRFKADPPSGWDAALGEWGPVAVCRTLADVAQELISWVLGVGSADLASSRDVVLSLVWEQLRALAVVEALGERAAVAARAAAATSRYQVA